MNPYEKTYCNPLPLPDYPLGRKCVAEDILCYRETADPTVLYEAGKWYLYSSCGMAYISEDFIHWQHVKIEPYDMGYAPTVVKHKGKFYMTACSSVLRVADNPLGPFEIVGDFTDIDGNIRHNDDPMLFSDDDGRLYLYWGCGGKGIYGVALDSEKPNRFISEPKILFSYNPAHLWEHVGDWNEDGSHSWIEGAYMFKHDEKYYLTYAGPGTEWTTYAMGAYISSSPLGEFTYMENSPFLTKKDGIVRGPGHGCIVKGPKDTLWAFYTCLLCHFHPYERRIGMDPVGIDETGNLYCRATEIPQWAPGIKENPEAGNDAGILPLNFHKKAFASSFAPGHDPLYAVDDSLLTWWQPEDNDPEPSLTVSLTEYGSKINSVRIFWRDVNLDIRKGIFPGAFQYKIQARFKNGEWLTVVDKSLSKDDFNIDYQVFEPTEADKVRLVISGWPEGIRPGVIHFAVFGRYLNSQFSDQ